MNNLEWCTGKYNTNYGTRNERASKKVVQYDSNMNIIKFWDKMSDVIQEGFDQGHVSKCCYGKLKTHGGYIWRFANKEVTMEYETYK